MEKTEPTSAPAKGGNRAHKRQSPDINKAAMPAGLFQPSGFSMFKARGAADNLRLNAMSDGVFAIVITLMVFEIKVPQIPAGQVSSQALSLALQAMLPDFARLFLSFVVLGIYWVGHNNVFQHVLKHDRLMLWLNIFFLLVVALIPFPASLLVRYGETQLSVVLYALNLLVGGVLLDLIWWYATYNRHLMCDSVGDALVHSFHQRILTGPAIYAVAILVSFFSLFLSKVLFGIAILYYLIPTIQDFLHHAQLNPQES
jgi:uncharacterized membrane protein